MIELKNIDKQLAEKMALLIKRFNEEHVESYSISPMCGKRTLIEQGRLWRQGRSTKAINEKIKSLVVKGADYIALKLNEAGRQKSLRQVTSALPGLSWHNWGKAMDCAIYDLGKETLPPIFIKDGSHPIYKSYADMAQDLGLTAGYYFKTFKDPMHVQLDPFEVLDRYTLEDVSDYFKNKGAV